MNNTSGVVDTIVGHIIPGTLFVIWGLWWFRRSTVALGPFTTDWESIVIIPMTVAGALLELWWVRWRLRDDSVMNFQHATMYGGFGISAIIYRLARRGMVDDRLPAWTLGGAFAVTATMFIAHGSPTPVSDAIHLWLALLLFGCALVCALEGNQPSRALAVARSWLTVTIGAWFFEAAWILGSNPYDQNSTAAVLRVRMFVVWHLAGVGLFFLGIRLFRDRLA